MCIDNTKKRKLDAMILENSEISPGIYKMIIESEGIGIIAKPGQFVNLYCKQNSRILPRPISICEIDSVNDTITLVYGVVGKGTEEFSYMKKGDRIEVLGPLGHGFNMDNEVTSHVIIGGGIGIPPLLELTKQLKGEKKVYLGFRSDTFLIKEFEKCGASVYIATDDGSSGLKGTVLDLLSNTNPNGQMIYSCGPKPMLKAVSEWAKIKQIKAQLSLEERMGCGIGTCVGCVCKIQAKGMDTWEYKKICKDGPVFFSEEVVWDV